MCSILLRTYLRNQFIEAIRSTFAKKYDPVQLEDWTFEDTIDDNVLGVKYSVQRRAIELFTKHPLGGELTHVYHHDNLLEMYLNPTLNADYIVEFKTRVDVEFGENATAVGLTPAEYIPLLDAVQELMYVMQSSVFGIMSSHHNRNRIEFTKTILTPVIDKLLSHDLSTLRQLIDDNQGRLKLQGNDEVITVTTSDSTGHLIFDNDKTICHVFKTTNGTTLVTHDVTANTEGDLWIPTESVEYLKLLIDLSKNLDKYINKHI